MVDIGHCQKTDRAPPLFLEFGVRDGRSITYLSSLSSGRQWHGFDSFQGLPGMSNAANATELSARQRIGWGRGRYTRKGEMPSVPKGVTLHKGWFNETLPLFLDGPSAESVSRSTAYKLPPAVAFAHMDADLYESTYEVLYQLATRCRLCAGTVLAFDELFGSPTVELQEWRALRRAARCFDFGFEFITYMAHPKTAFGRAAVRLTRVGPCVPSPARGYSGSTSAEAAAARCRADADV